MRDGHTDGLRDGRTDGTTAALQYPIRNALRGDNKTINVTSSWKIKRDLHMYKY